MHKLILGLLTLLAVNTAQALTPGETAAINKALLEKGLVGDYRNHWTVEAEVSRKELSPLVSLITVDVKDAHQDRRPAEFIVWWNCRKDQDFQNCEIRATENIPHAISE